MVRWKKGLLFCFYSVALMNHSCCPNVIVTYKGTLAEVRAVREIEPGEEVSALCLNVLQCYECTCPKNRIHPAYSLRSN